MRVIVKIPARFLPIYEEARQAARFQRLNNPDPRTAFLRELQEGRKERDRQAKIRRTMEIARLRTAERLTSSSSPCRPVVSSASRVRRERRDNVVVIDFGSGRG